MSNKPIKKPWTVEQDRGTDEKPAKISAIDRISAIPAPVKAAFLKFWFAGAVFFFVGFGTFVMSTDQLDITAAIGLIIGLVTDLILNPVMNSVDNGKYAMRKYMMFYAATKYSKDTKSAPQKPAWPKKTAFLFLNLLYGIFITFLVAVTYNLINILFANAGGSDDGVALGAEPILFGLFYLSYDFLFLGLRQLVLLWFFRRGKTEGGEKNV